MAHRNAMSRLSQTSQALLRTQGAALANPLWNIDNEQIALSLEAIASNREVVVARVYGEDAELMVEAGDVSDLSGDEIVFRRDIDFDAGTGARKIGEIEFVVTSREIWEQTRARLLLAAGIALAAVAMEVSAALFALRRIVGVPLERLLGAISAAGRGRKRQKVEAGSSDELGQVIDAFNTMLAQQEVFERELEAQARMEGELAIGRDMQLSLVPHEFDALTEGRGVTLWASLEPAREVGGDFYDAFLIDEDTLCVCIGDVSDKGVPAALLMAVTKTLVKGFAAGANRPGSIVRAVNEELCAGSHRDMFVTLFVGFLELRSGQLKSTNAGHNKPLCATREGVVREIPQLDGPVVGALPGIDYTEAVTQLSSGEMLLLFTDGVTEASGKSGTFFGDAALHALFAEHASKSPRDVIEAVFRAVAVHEAGADRSDDLTALAIRFEGKTAEWRTDIPADANTLSAAGEELAEALPSAPSDLISKTQLVLDEIGSNVVRHAEAAGDIALRISIEARHYARQMHLTIRDNGPAFDPATVGAPDTALPAEVRCEGGLGLHLVRNLSDSFDYSREGDRNRYVITLS
ncbi:SpoIIE family protein phosphatase [Defluviimonas sp. WL0024]|uniref:SpoIIE family protein phosphatase n=1 Tax=Albidovulum salinarum TaxID=2984153 RepID=A0ABT2X9B4_9RHOB|nr:SpoIIE family protein phosphatase [Defluviimonas sp. WL0024]MCU9850541.1 SpoIIE family protein phosphatase [Defluviimonas sp. WL0024]